MLSGFVGRKDQDLVLNGESFNIVGANVYYLGFVNQSVIEPILDLASAMELNVLRLWGFFEQKPDSNVYFHFFNATRGVPDFHDGADGLSRLDMAIFLAEQRGLRLIISLTDYWPAFGGMSA